MKGDLSQAHPQWAIGRTGKWHEYLLIQGDDMWIKDKVDLYIREISEHSTSFDTYEWFEDESWTYVASWSKDVAMSTDSDEGVKTLNLVLD